MPSKRKAALPEITPASKKAALSMAQKLPVELGEYIERDVKLLQQLGWSGLVKQRRSGGDFSSLQNVHHPAKRLLSFYKNRGAPVKLSTPPWTRRQVQRALHRGPHKSCFEHIEFLKEEFVDMISKGQWLVLPASAVKNLPGLRVSPPGVVPQRDRRPRWICDYSWSNVNADTLPLAAMEAMQFGHALDRILREILLANPAFGPVRLMKVDISDGFYRIDLNVDDIPKLGVVFPTVDGEEPLIAFPLVLPMGWKNSPPIFCTATETIADLANARLQAQLNHPEHPLDHLAASIPSPSPLQNNNSPAVARQGPAAQDFVSSAVAHLRPAESDVFPPVKRGVIPHEAARQGPAAQDFVSSAVAHLRPAENDVFPPVKWDVIPHEAADSCQVPAARDPSLPSTPQPVSKVEVFVDDFVGVSQQYTTGRKVRTILLHAIDDVLRPLNKNDHPSRREPVSLKKLRQGDCSWGTIKLVLGWIIDTESMTIQLPPHRVDRLAEILNSIPRHQRRTSVKKWHKVLGELRSMSLALPGSRHIFSTMQNALSHKKGARVALNKGVHHALDDFRYMHASISTRKTRIAELVPLAPIAEGHHDASGTGAGGIWFPAEHAIPRAGFKAGVPVLWRHEWPEYIVRRLITDKNPNGTLTNSDLELAGGLLHLDAVAQTFDTRERTILSKGDNLNTTFWERKGSTSTNKPPAYLLRLFGIHQRYHRYVPRFDYISGPSNPVADALSQRLVSSLDSITADRFRRDFCTSQATVQKGISPGRATNTNTAWGIWISFTDELGVDPFLKAFEDKVPFLQIFAQRIRSGELAPRGNSIRARSVEDYIRFVGQTFLHMGAEDIRLDSARGMDFRLKRTWAAWKKEDPPPNRVKPVPISVIRHISYLAQNSTQNQVHYQALADMIIIAFFYLLRPGEYTDTNNDSTPFRFEDVQLFIGDTRLALTTAPPEQLKQARFASLTFTDQKNGVRGEVIGLACSGDPFICPVQAIIRRILYLRSNNAPTVTPLARLFNTKSRVTAASITNILRDTVSVLGPTIGFLPKDVSARCLRAAGATALLLARVDTDIISLIGRWRSDEMLRYLHIQAYPLMKDYSRRMLNAGDYTVIPNQLVPQH